MLTSRSTADSFWLDQRADDEANMPRWTVPGYSKKQVNTAGRLLVDGTDDPEHFGNALVIINNWRSSHGFPLNTFQTTLRKRSRQYDPNAIIAQRIKRLSSIEHKLSRYPTMTLSQIQDIGGCRAILSEVELVRHLVESYRGSDLKHKLHTCDDYMENPKPTGYRGVHLIYRYNSDRVQTWNTLKVEMQIRSQVQHAWATAVEIVGTFTRQALKSSQGEDEWLRFFALMGTALAFREGTAPVPDTPQDANDLRAELRGLERHLNAIRRLETYGRAPQILEDADLKTNHYFLMQLNIAENRLTISAYPASGLQRASDAYLSFEKNSADRSSLDTVLVSVESLATLRSAYPNYFLDTKLFVQLVQEAIR